MMQTMELFVFLFYKYPQVFKNENKLERTGPNKPKENENSNSERYVHP